MRSDEAFEQALADWVEDGPMMAPPGPMEAAIDHVRAHPRQRRARPGPWRVAMSNLGASSFSSHSPLHRGAVAVLALTAAVALVATGIVVFLPAQHGIVGRAPAAAVAVSGSETCVTTEPGSRRDAVETTGRVDTCTVTTSDPRVSGTVTRSVTDQQYEPDPGPYYVGHDQWGEIALRNDGGAWRGWMVGSGPDPDFTVDMLALGDGEYAGLVYRASSVLEGDRWRVEGTIEPLRPGAVLGAVEMTVTEVPTPSTAPDGVAYWPAAELTWTLVTNDPRITGVAREVSDRETRPDGTERASGTVDLAGQDGTWVGSFETDSAIDPYVRTGDLIGSGRDAGRVFRYTLRTRDSYHHLLEGVVEAMR